MSDAKKTRGRSQLLLIAAVFFGPLLLAVWLYIGPDSLRPDGRANHGALLEPIVNLQDVVSDSPLHPRHERRWLLLYDANGGCGDDCRSGLYAIRQLRLMLGREMERLGRILLHRDSALDTVFLAEEHQGLIALQDPALSDALNEKKPDELQAGGYYLIDPQGNLVMYFEPGLDPRDIVDDIKRLLRLSRIG